MVIRFEIGVRTIKIYKMGWSPKIGIFGRFERGPFKAQAHPNHLISGRWYGAVAASSASYHRPFVNNFSANWAIFMKFKIGVRIKIICKLGLTWKFGTFGRFERCPLERVGIN